MPLVTSHSLGKTSNCSNYFFHNSVHKARRPKFKKKNQHNPQLDASSSIASRNLVKESINRFTVGATTITNSKTDLLSRDEPTGRQARESGHVIYRSQVEATLSPNFTLESATAAPICIIDPPNQRWCDCTLNSKIQNNIFINTYARRVFQTLKTTSKLFVYPKR